MRRSSLIVVVTVFLSVLFTGMSLLPEVRASILYVGGGGPGNYTSIQSAINIANAGDTVFIYNGSYPERISINQPLNLVGEDENATVIDGGGTWTVVHLFSDWVNISRLTITGSGLVWGDAGIKLDSVHNCGMSNLIVKGNYVGISLSQAHDNSIVNSSILGNYLGLETFDSRRVLVLGNEIRANDIAGVYEFFGDGTMDRNELSGNDVAFALYESVGSVLTGNSMVGEGIVIDGWQGESWNTHTIDTSNTVNGNPVYYLKNVTDGSVPLGAGQVILANCTNVTVENQNMSNGTMAIQGGFSNGNLIRNNTISGQSNSGIDLSRSKNDTVRANVVSDSYYGVSLHNSENITVRDNNLFANEYGISVRFSNNGTVLNNTITQSWAGIDISFSRWASLTDNTMVDDGIGLRGFDVEEWNSHLIDTSNRVNGKPIHYWRNATGGTVASDAGQVILSNCTGVTIENLNISGGDAAILLGFSSGNTIANNNISTARDGIVLDASDFNLVQTNSLSSNNRLAIGMFESASNNLTANTMVNNGIGIDGSLSGFWNTHFIDTSNMVNSKPVYYWKNAVGGTVPANAGQVILANSAGVTVENQHIVNASVGILLGFSFNNLVKNNSLSENGYGGTGLDYSNGNTVTGNNISSNGFGTILSLSDGNQVYHNNFVRNVEQAMDLGNFNQWDSGYPSGGNYWSDYEGTDYLSGLGQDQPGRDGLGDTPRNVFMDAQDRYPLISPIGSIPPKPPTIMDASLGGGNYENVQVSWALSSDDGSGNLSVVGYEVFRGTTLDLSGLSYDFIGSLPNGTTVFVDALAGEGNPDDYFYQVCAIDSLGNRGCSSNQAAKFTRSLPLGPNLVSIPLIQSNETIESVFQTVHYDRAWAFDSVSHKWNWYMTSKGYRRGLWNVTHTMGLWVNVTEDSNLTVVGIVPSQTTIHLQEGWNLVSFPSFNSSYTVADLKSELPVERVEGFDPTALPNFLRVLQDSDVLLAGEGYWVRVDAAVDWIVEVS
jgi:parallel beta-helix repeat protein